METCYGQADLIKEGIEELTFKDKEREEPYLLRRPVKKKR